MYNLLKKSFILSLLVATFLLSSSCGNASAAGTGSDDEQNDIILQLQEEIVRLQQDMDELQAVEAPEPTPTPDPTPAPNSTPDPTPAPPANTAGGQPPVVVEIHMPEQSPSPSPSPTPTPTPAPADIPGRWVTVGAFQDGESMHVPAEQSMEIDFFANGTGMMTIDGTGSAFTWTGGDTGPAGRIVMNFTGFFGTDARSETMTYQIHGTQMNLTHTLFYEVISTILRKSE